MRPANLLSPLCAAALLCALAACGNKNANNTNTAGNSATAAIPPAGSTTAAAGEVTPTPDVSKWDDNNIVASIVAGDKAEVQMGRLAESKATIPAVRDFARTLVQDHSKGEKEIRDLASKAKLTAKPAANDSGTVAAEGVRKRLEAMPKGNAWDSTFVKYEYDEHHSDIDAAKSMQNQAKDSLLKQYLGNEIPALQKHEDAANKLLGNDGGTAAWKNADVQKTESSKEHAKNTPNGKTKY